MIRCVLMIDVGKKKEKKMKKKKVQRSIPESRTESKRVTRRYCRYWNGGAKMAMPASPATWCWLVLVAMHANKVDCSTFEAQ